MGYGISMLMKQWQNLTEADKAMLLRRNPHIQTEVARTLGVSQGTVSQVWWGKATSARILAEILAVVKP